MAYSLNEVQTRSNSWFAFDEFLLMTVLIDQFHVLLKDWEYPKKGGQIADRKTDEGAWPGRDDFNVLTETLTNKFNANHIFHFGNETNTDVLTGAFNAVTGLLKANPDKNYLMFLVVDSEVTAKDGKVEIILN